MPFIYFALAVYGVANAIAVLKIGIYFFGEPVDEIILKTGEKLPGRIVSDQAVSFEIEGPYGEKTTVPKTEIHKIQKRKGLGRIPYLGDLFYCPACLSFWIGMGISAWVFSPSTELVPFRPHAIILDGLVASSISWILHVLTMKLAHGVDDV